MAKRGRAPELRVVRPVLEEIVDAPEAIPVEFLINWEVPFHNREDHIQEGFAIAWTKSAGLVVWREHDFAITAWLPAAHIRRRHRSPQAELKVNRAMNPPT